MPPRSLSREVAAKTRQVRYDHGRTPYAHALACTGRVPLRHYAETGRTEGLWCSRPSLDALTKPGETLCHTVPKRQLPRVIRFHCGSTAMRILRASPGGCQGASPK